MNEQLRSPKKRSRYYPIQAPIEYRVHGERLWRKGVSRNISDTEIVFEAECELNQGIQFEAHLSLPPIADQETAISFQATVVRSSEGGMCAARIFSGRLCRSRQTSSHHLTPPANARKPPVRAATSRLAEAADPCELPDALSA